MMKIVLPSAEPYLGRLLSAKAKRANALGKQFSKKKKNCDVTLTELISFSWRLRSQLTKVARSSSWVTLALKRKFQREDWS